MDPRTPGTPPHGNALVSAAVVGELVETVGPEATLAFFERFVALWPVRRERLSCAIGRRDVAAGLDAALSLRSGACMTGSFPLADVGDRLHGLIGRGAADTTATGLGPDAPWADAEALLAELDVLGERTVSALRGLAAELQARTVEVPALGGPAPAVPSPVRPSLAPVPPSAVSPSAVSPSTIAPTPIAPSAIAPLGSLGRAS